IAVVLATRFLLFRKHGFVGDTSKRRPDEPFWPDQALRNAVVCLAFMATILFLTLRFGAPLGAPADPSEPFSAARPEWSFLFMFQFLKQFPGSAEIWGAIIVPTIVLLVFALMPFIARKKRGHQFNIAFFCAILAAAAGLTWWAKSSDAKNAGYQFAVKEAGANGARARALAHARGIPPTGALALLRSDPLTQGPKLFAANCASCHRFNGH